MKIDYRIVFIYGNFETMILFFITHVHDDENKY